MGSIKRTLMLVGVICLLVGVTGGIYLEKTVLSKQSEASVTIGQTATPQVTITKLPVEQVDVSNGVTEANAVQYGTQVVDNVMAQLASGVVEARASTALTQTDSTSKLLDKAISTAQAFDCGAVVQVAADMAMKYWGPSGASVCSEVDVEANIAYDVHNVKNDNFGVLKITASDNVSTISYKDPNCIAKTKKLNLGTRVKYYSWSYSDVPGSPTKLIFMNEIYDWVYNQELKRNEGNWENWCKGEFTKGYQIGKISNCPRCNKKGGGSGGGRP